MRTREDREGGSIHAGNHPEHAAETAEWNGTTYFFDSEDCTRRFADAPTRYVTALARPTS